MQMALEFQKVRALKIATRRRPALPLPMHQLPPPFAMCPRQVARFSPSGAAPMCQHDVHESRDAIAYLNNEHRLWMAFNEPTSLDDHPIDSRCALSCLGYVARDRAWGQRAVARRISNALSIDRAASANAKVTRGYRRAPTLAIVGGSHDCVRGAKALGKVAFGAG
jgi:hypothetical protein